ncbi:MAG: hypothetical protein KAI66_00680, partial [Lentisphaeria bacterium]|nr:hypothetical protein [Lentisphaeria bacterium]
ITTSTTPLQLAQLWGVTRSDRHYSGGLDTISSIDLWEIGNLASDVSALADRLTILLGTWPEYERIMYAKLHAEWFPYTDTSYMDLGNFCTYLDMFLSDTTARNLAQAVIARLSSVVVAMVNSSSFSSATGLSIYLPHYHDVAWANSSGGPSLANYNGTNLAFCANETWDEFVNAWLATNFYTDPYEPNDSPATAFNFGTASDNPWAVRYRKWEADFDDGSEDWYQITIPFPFDLDVWVWCTEYYSDTVIYAYDSLANAQNGISFASNDDGMQGLGYPSYGSRIYATGGSPGTYYLKVVPWGGNYGDYRDYEIWFTVSRRDTPAVFRVEPDGTALMDGTLYSPAIASGSADVAEWVNVSEPVEPGDVLELDPENAGQYRKARSGCSSLLAGVVSTDPGVVLGSGLLSPPTTPHSPPATDYALLALVG